MINNSQADVKLECTSNVRQKSNIQSDLHFASADFFLEKMTVIMYH